MHMSNEARSVLQTIVPTLVTCTSGASQLRLLWCFMFPAESSGACDAVDSLIVAGLLFSSL